MSEKQDDVTFEMSFSSYDNHCCGSIDMALEGVEYPLGFDGVDRDDPTEVSALLTSLVATDGPEMSTEHTEQILCAITELEACAEQRCQCHTWAYECVVDNFDTVLSSLDQECWAVRDHCDVGQGFLGELSLSALFDLVPVRSYGFDDVSISYDGSLLTVSFSGYPWGSHSLELVECTGVREDLHNCCDDWIDDVQATAALCFEPEPFIERLVRLHTRTHVDDYGENMCLTELADVVRANVDLDDSAVAVLQEMYPGWPAPFRDLVSSVSSLLCAAA